MVDPGEKHGDVADKPVVDWDELWQELDLPVDPFAACSDRTGDPPPNLGEALRAYNPRPSPRVLTPKEVWDHWVVDVWKRRIEHDYDNVIVITGDPGCGKSSLAIQIARAMDRRFDLSSLAYRASELLDAIDRMKRGQCIVFDEAILGLLGREFATEEARAIVKTLNVTRFLGLNTIVCIPNIWDLDAALRGRRTDFWLTCSYDPRGSAVVHERARSVRYEYDRSLGLYRDEAWSPIRWSPLPPKLKEAYLNQKNEKVRAFLRETRSQLRETGAERDSGAAVLQERRSIIRRLLARGFTQHEAREIVACDIYLVQEVARDSG